METVFSFQFSLAVKVDPMVVLRCEEEATSAMSPLK
jgi:hypothetical protein